VGETTVKASLSHDGSFVEGTSTVIVTNGSLPTELVAIAVTPMNLVNPHQTSQQFMATGRYGDGRRADLTNEGTWSLVVVPIPASPDNPECLGSNCGLQTTVSNSEGSRGLLSAGSEEGFIIKARLGAVEGQASLSVR
jgi:hypothetical protein